MHTQSSTHAYWNNVNFRTFDIFLHGISVFIFLGITVIYLFFYSYICLYYDGNLPETLRLPGKYLESIHPTSRSLCTRPYARPLPPPSATRPETLTMPPISAGPPLAPRPPTTLKLLACPPATTLHLPPKPPAETPAGTTRATSAPFYHDLPRSIPWCPPPPTAAPAAPFSTHAPPLGDYLPRTSMRPPASPRPPISLAAAAISPRLRFPPLQPPWPRLPL